jgi:hypothetical protein
VEEIGFTGGEPFLNREVPAMLRRAAPRPPRAGAHQRHEADAEPRRRPPGAAGGVRPTGSRSASAWTTTTPTCTTWSGRRGSFAVALDGLEWLAREGFRVHVAGRAAFGREGEAAMRGGFARLFAARGIPIDASDPVALMLFPEMDAGRDVPEITEAAGASSARARTASCAPPPAWWRSAGRGAAGGARLHPAALRPALRAGRTLAEASRPVPLNHPHCARFCVLGGAACSR